MGKLSNKSGFTLLEILVVIIIVGVLASVAMPQLFRNVERSRSTEAMNTIGVIKRAMDGCAMQFNDVYTTCNTFAAVGIQDPGATGGIAGAHFNYAINVTGATAFTVTATRITLDNGVAGGTVVLTRAGTAITRSGTGAFLGIQ